MVVNNKSGFGKVLVAWYEENRRELPWRDTNDPYLIWISEIILQQTRVVQGLDYFNRFAARFPDVRSLAEAKEDEVLKYWQGLGYYSRARNLHAAARDIMQRFSGLFPARYEDVLSLKGIGEYTAAAICSFAWNQPYAVVDGNVYRVLSRVFGIDVPIDSTEGKKFFAALAQELLLVSCPGIYNQAIMDFGAIQCVPKSPACLFCPLREKCAAFVRGEVENLPVKAGKTLVKPRYFNYFHIHYRDNVLLVQRRAKDIWQNLYEYPLIETEKDMEWPELIRTAEYRHLWEGAGEIHVVRRAGPYKHVLSHRIIYARFYEIRINVLPVGLANCLQVSADDFEKYAVSRLISLYLEDRNR